jgi:hypothetical protein
MQMPVRQTKEKKVRKSKKRRVEESNRIESNQASRSSNAEITPRAVRGGDVRRLRIAAPVAKMVLLVLDGPVVVPVAGVGLVFVPLVESEGAVEATGVATELGVEGEGDAGVFAEEEDLAGGVDLAGGLDAGVLLSGAEACGVDGLDAGMGEVLGGAASLVEVFSGGCWLDDFGVGDLVLDGGSGTKVLAVFGGAWLSVVALNI